MKKLIGFLMVAGLVIASSGMAQADLSWQVAPILGTSTYGYSNPLGCYDVIVVTAGGEVNIPHSTIVYDPRSMALFYVGQTIDAGSGIYYGQEGNPYHWSVVYTGPTRTVSYGVGIAGNYPGDSTEGYVMNSNDPVSILTDADVGNWNYTETWIDLSGKENTLTYSVNFKVAAVPEPGTLILLGSGLLGLALTGARKKFRK